MVLCNQDNGGLELIGEKIRFMSAGAGYNSPNISQHYTPFINNHLICTSVFCWDIIPPLWLKVRLNIYFTICKFWELSMSIEEKFVPLKSQSEPINCPPSRLQNFTEPHFQIDFDLMEEQQTWKYRKRFLEYWISNFAYGAWLWAQPSLWSICHFMQTFNCF